MVGYLRALADQEVLLVEVLKGRPSANEPIAVHYSSFPAIFATYKKFVGAQMPFIGKLSYILQKSTKANEIIRQHKTNPLTNGLDVRQVVFFPFTFSQLWNLLGATIRRLPMLYQTLAAQFHLFLASDIAATACMDYRDVYRKSPHNTVSSKVVMDTCRVVETTLTQLSDLVTEAAKVEPLYAAMAVTQQIAMSPTDQLPYNISRKLVKQGEVLIKYSREIGLSVEVPVTLILFSDYLVACTKRSSKHSRFLQMHSYFDVRNLLILDNECNSKEPTFQLDTIKVLPPGWQEAVDVVPGNGRRRIWANKQLKLTQNDPPEAYTSLYPMGPTTILVTHAEKTEWITALTTVSTFLPIVPPLSESRKKPFPYFGNYLDLVVAHDKAVASGITVPILVKRFIHHLLCYSLGDEGIFRLSGEKEAVENLRKSVDDGKIMELKLHGVYSHTISTALKQYLRELQEPPVPFSQYDTFVQLAGQPNDLFVPRLQKHLQALPHDHYKLMQEVVSFLYMISCNQHVNNMTSENLATVVAPTLLRMPNEVDPALQMATVAQAISVVSRMISLYPILFEDDVAEAEMANSLDFAGFRRKLLGHKKPVRVLIYIQNTDQVWSVDDDGGIVIWNASKWMYVDRLAIPAAGVTAGAATEQRVFIGSMRFIHIINAHTREVVMQLSEKCYSMQVHDRELWCGSEECIFIHSLNSETLEQVNRISVPGLSVLCITRAGDKMWVAGNHGDEAHDHEIYVLDRHLNRVASIKAHHKKINALKYVAETVWSCSDDGTIAVWDTSLYTRVDMMSRHHGAVTNLTTLRKQVVSCGRDLSMLIWDSYSCRCVGELKGFHTDTVTALLPIPATLTRPEIPRTPSDSLLGAIPQIATPVGSAAIVAPGSSFVMLSGQQQLQEQQATSEASRPTCRIRQAAMAVPDQSSKRVQRSTANVAAAVAAAAAAASSAAPAGATPSPSFRPRPSPQRSLGVACAGPLPPSLRLRVADGDVPPPSEPPPSPSPPPPPPPPPAAIVVDDLLVPATSPPLGPVSPASAWNLWSASFDMSVCVWRAHHVATRFAPKASLSLADRKRLLAKN
eukprot:TRINITY_DN1423_c0_g2_i5.p1 TRINITY_DN1423_c0_g2~~TRINITY_DN1423_c0_g2_i5.p1  ORF type:complete len:1154 (+),score=285.08 TRINITY_DN1423_c0_g2_i5:235-3462(+)